MQIFNTTPYNQKTRYTPYPPSHTPTVEEYFMEYYFNHKKEFPNDIEYIPVLWLNYEVHQQMKNSSNGEKEKKVQDIPSHNFNRNYQTSKTLLNWLNQNYHNPKKKYFTVSLMGIPRQYLKPNYLVFASEKEDVGFVEHTADIPIPLLLQPHTSSPSRGKKYLASFVGTLDTHYLRWELYKYYKNNSEFKFITKEFHSTPLSDQQISSFNEITSKSTFTLCPRGNGNTSFRIVEAMQLGSIPIYISNDFWLPFEDEINWDEFSVIIPENKIRGLNQILASYSQTEITKMQIKGQEMLKKYFNIESTCEWIKNYLKQTPPTKNFNYQRNKKNMTLNKIKNKLKKIYAKRIS